MLRERLYPRDDGCASLAHTETATFSSSATRAVLIPSDVPALSEDRDSHPDARQQHGFSPGAASHAASHTASGGWKSALRSRLYSGTLVGETSGQLAMTQVPSMRQLTLAERPPAATSSSTVKDWRAKLSGRLHPAEREKSTEKRRVETIDFASGSHVYRIVQPVSGAKRRDTGLREAGREVARRRAQRLAADTSEGRIGAALPFLEDIFLAADGLAEYGINYNTNTKDAHAWDEWEHFCEMMETVPLRTARMVQEDPERESIILAHFALWVYPRIKPRSSSATWAKPSSALAYPLAMIRIFGRWGVHLPKITSIRAEMSGLMRTVVNVFGSRFLVPHRKDPLTLDMIQAVANIARGAPVGGRPWNPSSFGAVQLVDMLSFMIVTGFRLGELVYHNSGEFMYLVWADVTAVIDGVTYSDPSEAQWASMKTGDTSPVYREASGH